jgi:hypothetical protein
VIHDRKQTDRWKRLATHGRTMHVSHSSLSGQARVTTRALIIDDVPGAVLADSGCVEIQAGPKKISHNTAPMTGITCTSSLA